MKSIYIKDLKKDQELTEFFMAKTLMIKVGSNGKQYLDITLGDKTGEISAKKWDVSDSEYPTLKAIPDKSIVRPGHRMGRAAAAEDTAHKAG